MCKAIQDIRLEAIEQGIKQGIEQEHKRMIIVMVNLLRSMRLPDEEIVDRIVQNSGISEEEASRYVYGENN